MQVGSCARAYTKSRRPPISVGLETLVVDINFLIRAPKEGHPYWPVDEPQQEDWESVADKFGVDVDVLISFNFVTTNSDVVNWCLRHYVGCKKVRPSGINWMFSKSARPGAIFIPPWQKIGRLISTQKTFAYGRRNPRRRFCGHWIGLLKRSREKRGKRIQRLMQVVLSKPASHLLGAICGIIMIWLLKCTLIGRLIIQNAGSRPKRRREHSPLMDKRYGTHSLLAKQVG